MQRERVLLYGNRIFPKLLKCINQNLQASANDAPTNEIEMNVCDRASMPPRYTNPFTCEKHQSATAPKRNTSNSTFLNVFARYVEQPCLLTLQFAYMYMQCIERRYCAQQINNSHNVNLRTRRMPPPLAWCACICHFACRNPFAVLMRVRNFMFTCKMKMAINNM